MKMRKDLIGSGYSILMAIFPSFPSNRNASFGGYTHFHTDEIFHCDNACSLVGASVIILKRDFNPLVERSQACFFDL